MSETTRISSITRRQFGLTAFGLSALAAGLTACSGGGGGSSSDGGAKTLQLILSGDTNQGGAFAAAAKKYKEATGITIEVVDVPTADITTKLKNAATANDLPALARVTGLDPLWANQLQDLTDIAKSHNIDPNFLQQSPDGIIPAIPSDLTAVGLFINKSLFTKAGVAFPTSIDTTWTWDEFIAAVNQVREKAGAKYGVVMDRSGHRLRAMMYEFGSTAFAKENGKYTGDSKAVETLEYFKKINDDQTMPKSVWLSGEDGNAMFKSGQVAAYYSGSWQVADFNKNIKDFEWLSVPLPKKDVNATNLGGGFMVAFKDTGADEEARKFIDWFYNDANYTEFAKTGGYLPVKDLKVDYPFQQASFELYQKQIAGNQAKGDNAIKRVVIEAYAETPFSGDPLREETVKMLSGGQDAKTTVDNIVKLYNGA
ncbi:extracellular solute-binding protein [Pseudarthrobacter sp. AG30]|uniref:ABC transporter substrate-binding protein n=1 Tax=Micrococcaceae TaxID=1268 RepID=UPI000D646ECF|nr:MULTISPECIES: extracellular solute-binding protein [Micrococcaceae]RAX16879.1 extracellular solute-binding protein [Pseudarthrobacter sp. AG30]TDT86114.1 alpha-1,4-digalacturonate transport system substrate-binding protein [Arthrobacter sp. AG258]